MPERLQFTDRAEMVFTLAVREARRLGQKHIGTEHILMAVITQEGSIGLRVLMNLGIHSRQVREEIEKLAESSQCDVSDHAGGATPRAVSALAHAVKEARALHQGYIGTEHILLALLRDPYCVATQVLAMFGVTFEKAREQILVILGDRSSWQDGSEGLACAGNAFESTSFDAEQFSQVAYGGWKSDILLGASMSRFKVFAIQFAWALLASAALGVMAQSFSVAMIAFVFLEVQMSISLVATMPGLMDYSPRNS